MLSHNVVEGKARTRGAARMTRQLAGGAERHRLTSGRQSRGVAELFLGGIVVATPALGRNSLR
ncbi:MAG: hypothetical protein ABR568_13105 [Pyrinomonadaceae bacterium]